MFSAEEPHFDDEFWAGVHRRAARIRAHRVLERQARAERAAAPRRVSGRSRMRASQRHRFIVLDGRRRMTGPSRIWPAPAPDFTVPAAASGAGFSAWVKSVAPTPVPDVDVIAKYAARIITSMVRREITMAVLSPDSHAALPAGPSLPLPIARARIPDPGASALEVCINGTGMVGAPVVAGASPLVRLRRGMALEPVRLDLAHTCEQQQASPLLLVMLHSRNSCDIGSVSDPRRCEGVDETASGPSSRILRLFLHLVGRGRSSTIDEPVEQMFSISESTILVPASKLRADGVIADFVGPWTDLQTCGCRDAVDRFTHDEGSWIDHRDEAFEVAEGETSPGDVDDRTGRPEDGPSRLRRRVSGEEGRAPVVPHACVPAGQSRAPITD